MTPFSLESLSWELSVLSKAVAYKNLSGAAQNVGISQPQLSRIVGKLEAELRGVLLDRSSRRKSGWTPLAFQLSEVYLKSARSLSADVRELMEGSEPRLIHIGTLEGLIPLAAKFARHILDHAGVETVELDVYDLNLLEERFFKAELDVVFTAREPGRKKYRYRKPLGFQSLEWIRSDERFRVMSSFEFGIWEAKAARSAKRRSSTEASDKTLISNSLVVRQQWIKAYGGTGTLPSPVRATRRAAPSGEKKVADEEVLLFAQDSVSPAFWEKASRFQ